MTMITAINSRLATTIMHSHPASRLHSYLTMQQSVEGDQNTPRIVLTIATTSAFISVLVRVRQEVLEEEGSTIASS